MPNVHSFGASLNDYLLDRNVWRTHTIFDHANVVLDAT
jgi:hypothetical protein